MLILSTWLEWWMTSVILLVSGIWGNLILTLQQKCVISMEFVHTLDEVHMFSSCPLYQRVNIHLANGHAMCNTKVLLSNKSNFCLTKVTFVNESDFCLDKSCIWQRKYGCCKRRPIFFSVLMFSCYWAPSGQGGQSISYLSHQVNRVISLVIHLHVSGRILFYLCGK